ncbi:MAG: DUF108 domain-containing protein [Candidatus Omnitrophica bacterium]|nr:DUF108 domain-containing protein [Candidatus Omnitrophota bacterium]
MKRSSGKLKLGIVGCGAIGSRMALSTRKELRSQFMLSALYDIDAAKSRKLSERLKSPRIVKKSLASLLSSSDIIVECVNTSGTVDIVRQALMARKSVLAMSVGRLLNQKSLFSLAERNKVSLFIPSGAIAGLDAVKAVTLAGFSTITLTTRKPLAGFEGNPYIKEKGINLKNAKKDVVLFDGHAREAVKYFPQNINVAAALQLAAGPRCVLRVKIVAAPKLARNTHEIVLEGPFGRIVTRTENEVCPDNPKTSYLAVLSAIQTLKQCYYQVKIGT